jgi:myo-inositol-1-phosphate synthase
MARTGAVFGGEHSGHFYFRNFWYADSGMLAALHTLAALGETDGTAGGHVTAGPSDYAPALHDHKVGYIHIEGRGLLGSPISIEVRLTVEDSPNAAPIAIDGIRAAVAARRHGLAGYVPDVGGLLFKAPRVPLPDHEALEAFERFVDEVRA